MTPKEQLKQLLIFLKTNLRVCYHSNKNYNSTEEIFEEIRENVPQYKGITYERLKEAGGIQWPCPSEDSQGTETFYEDEFKTDDGLGHFQVVEYEEPLEVTNEEYPYVFTNGRVLYHYHTGTMPRKIKELDEEIKQGFAEINPKDAKDLGIENDDEVILESRRGEVETIARVTEDILEGVVFMPFHFSECVANVLTGPTSGPPSKMPEFKFCAIKIRPK